MNATERLARAIALRLGYGRVLREIDAGEEQGALPHVDAEQLRTLARDGLEQLERDLVDYAEEAR
jgi:hypothetical protein